ncbi:(2R)-sulfolactate sulfo-lyase subunit beta precursor [Variibacter gotjawalensis]|uniref:(2R)-sulfolactate sulfo-lyase subunit beta n=1 Tax=Variibacter gotjawalensis TaxID=1333996 RepID=A0A0S3Q0U7_9BRAD|nr:UxaA family hydrolase [Variibacter gotjawalensis]NIK47673.1 altronate dehydratase large subunit [Variibacter gotjawalensis]RZS49571.1 altronate dehydratase large subunit [Variibacter gotjawalensis]BAT61833.1 (2R)-sulfolactate sulfo-lyase subunit beta precursor [Variibacter gotjawalensis]
MQSFQGYERPDGSAGIRNLVAIVSVMDTCNPVTRGIAAAIKGSVYIPGSYIRGQLGRDRAITLNATAGLCRNPNIAAVVVVGLEPHTTTELVNLIKASGKPVGSVDIQIAGGTIEAIALGTRLAANFARQASKQTRRSFPLSKLLLGLECGGSDTTSGLASNPSIGVVADKVVAAGGSAIISETSEFFGAEHLFADRAIDSAVREKFLHEVNDVEQQIISQGVDLRGSNPTPDNIRGGLTTIEEKALGAMAKSGTSPLVDVLGYGEGPTKPGLHFMNGPAPAVESITGLAAAGCQLALFSTGVGNPIGHPVMTVVKVSGNRNTIDTFSDNVDFDVSAVLEKDETIDSAGTRLFEHMISIASGELTTSEVLSVQESAISRFGLSM